MLSYYVHVYYLSLCISMYMYTVHFLPVARLTRLAEAVVDLPYNPGKETGVNRLGKGVPAVVSLGQLLQGDQRLSYIEETEH